MRILIVEDDKRLATNIQKLLSINHLVGDILTLGKDALFKLETEEYDGVILDWMLPDMNGTDLCELLRKRKNSIPILMLTAKGQDEDVVMGLKSGADDYLIKPFSVEVLIARLQSLLRRRTQPIEQPLLKVGPLSLNKNTCEVKRDNIKIALAPKEYALLECLMMNKGKALDRMYLMEHVWGEQIDELSNTVDVHIRYLRIKIDGDNKKKLIQTVKGKGYLICD